MISISENEYDQLKSELANIKICITRYIGYIISVAGLGSLLAKFIADSKDAVEYSIIVVVISILIITLLFEVIWYKFKSHNRYVGYIQLISQETGFHILEEHFRTNRNQKPYLLENPQKIELEKIPSIYTWEYVMSRYNNSKRNNGADTDKKIVKSANKTFFDFEVPFQYHSYKEQIYKYDIDYHFFDKIINPLYSRSGQRRINLNFVQDSFISLKYLFYDSKDKKLRVNKFKVDEKYIVNGWGYPRKVLQITFVSVLMLLFYGAIMLHFTSYNISESKGIYRMISSYKHLIYNFFILTIIWFWLRKYVNKLSDLVNGSHSIDGYCWSFFHFRVQFLNGLNLIPVYFSRGFLRYFKSYLYILEGRNLYNNIRKIENNSIKTECNRCKEEECFCKDESCNICNPPLGNIKFIHDEHKRLLCDRCRKIFESELFHALPLSKYSKTIHKDIKDNLPQKIKKEEIVCIV